MSLTAEERQELIHRPFPISVAYKGRIWAGVHITDLDLSDQESDDEYDGIYADWTNLELLHAQPTGCRDAETFILQRCINGYEYRWRA